LIENKSHIGYVLEIMSNISLLSDIIISLNLNILGDANYRL